MSGCLIFYYHSGIGLTLYLMASLLILIAAVLYYHLLPASLPCTLELPASCAKNQKVTGYLHVVQHGRLPIYHGRARIRIHSLYYRKEEEISLDIMLMGGEEGIAAFDLQMPYAGMVEVILEEAELYGIFHIGRKVILSSLKRSVMVLPDTRELRLDFPDLGGIHEDGMEIREDVRGYDPGMYYGIRPYVDGDSIKHIHWKLTGKTEEYMVKELGVPSGTEPRLYLDTQLSDLRPEKIDCLIEDYFSCSIELLARGIPHILCWHKEGGHLEEYPVENYLMLEECMEPLYRVNFWEDIHTGTDCRIYYMSHDGQVAYGLYRQEEGVYLQKREYQIF